MPDNKEKETSVRNVRGCCPLQIVEVVENEKEGEKFVTKIANSDKAFRIDREAFKDPTNYVSIRLEGKFKEEDKKDKDDPVI